MKKIGCGFYYTVYDLGNERVLKKRKSSLRKFITHILWKVSSLLHAKKINRPKYSFSLHDFSERKSTEAVKRLPKDFPSKLLGNPQFIEELEYEQVKVQILKNYFKTHSFEENTKIIDMYVELVKELWTWGISDATFNFSINNGLTKKGELILIDFNELDLKYEDLQKKLENKFYLKQYSYFRMKDETLKKYVKETFERELNSKELKKHWRKVVL